jgi:hypothetical protein
MRQRRSGQMGVLGDGQTDLVAELAFVLWGLAHDAVPHVIPEVIGGAVDGVVEQPLGSFVAAQGARIRKEYQLPEPLLGPLPANVTVLVVGQNPGYDADNESSPRFGTPLDTYVGWFGSFCVSQRHPTTNQLAKHVNGEWTEIRHYAEVEDILAASTSLGPHALGRTAVYADAHPWKWRRAKGRKPGPPSLGAQLVRTQIRERVYRIVERLRPTLVITLGRHAARPFGTLPAMSKAPVVVQACLGQWNGLHLPSLHLNAQGAPRTYYAQVKQRLAETIA